MDTEITYVENALRNRLRTYQPDPGFVSSLKQRLTAVPSVELEKNIPRPQTFLLVGGVILFFATFFWILSKLGRRKA